MKFASLKRQWQKLQMQKISYNFIHISEADTAMQTP